MPTYELSESSRLATPAEQVWAHALTPAGVNLELRPLARMTFPIDTESLEPSEALLGKPLFRSWILLFGIIPADYDEVTFVEFEDGHRFLECSPMLSQRLWQHERIVEPISGGCRLTDRLKLSPKIAILGPIYERIFRLTFTLRHRNLRKLFGDLGASSV